MCKYRVRVNYVFFLFSIGLRYISRSVEKFTRHFNFVAQMQKLIAH